MSEHPAARVTDPFGHEGGVGGAIAGLAVGAVLAAGIIATGGTGAVAVGAMLATTGAGGLIGSMMGAPSGVLVTGSPNVLIDRLPATMVLLAAGPCSRDGSTPRPVATGAASVLINGQPAARVSDAMVCGAIILSGSPDVLIGGPTQSPICASLRAEEATLERFRIDAQAAAAAYDPPETRKAPDGYHNATPEELRRLGLNKAMLEHPVDPTTHKPTEFRAAVFMNNKTGAPLVAYKGTSPLSGDDWSANVNQGLGHETFYYNQAQKIATNVAESPDGADAHLTGHSLGGGMASAGAEASGLPATTFNAAGLNAKTVPHPVPANIDAIYVKGEILRASQSLPLMPKSAATQTWPLDPTDYKTQAIVAGTIIAPPIVRGAALAVRAGLLHMMGAVDSALAQKRADVERALAKNGC